MHTPKNFSIMLRVHSFKRAVRGEIVPVEEVIVVVGDSVRETVSTKASGMGSAALKM